MFTVESEFLLYIHLAISLLKKMKIFSFHLLII